MKENGFRFGRVLRRLRTARSLSGRELARRSDLPECAICHYENGRRVPQADSLGRIADELSVPAAVLSWFAYTSRSCLAEDADLLAVERMMWDSVRRYEKHCKRESAR